MYVSRSDSYRLIIEVNIFVSIPYKYIKRRNGKFQKKFSEEQKKCEVIFRVLKDMRFLEDLCSIELYCSFNFVLFFLFFFQFKVELTFT